MKNSLKKNFFYNLVYQILVLVIPLITTPYVSRVLEPSGIGTYSYILSIVTYFIIFGTLGVSMYGQREIAYVQDDINSRSQIFFEIIIIRFFTLLISGIIYYFVFAVNKENSILYKIFIFEILANMVDINWFFQGMEEFKKIVIRNIIIKVLGVICIFVFVNTKNDLWIYILIYVLSNLFSNISLWFYLPKMICKISFNKLQISKRIKPIISMFLPQIAIQIYTVLDKTMLGYMLNDMNEVGYYEQALKISKMGLAVITAFSTVMMPKIARAASKNNKKLIEENLMKSFRFVWLFGTAISFGLISVISNFVPWFLGDGYDAVIPLTIILSWLVIAIGLNNVSGIQYLVQTKKQNVFTITVLIGALINFTFNFITIRTFHSIGAACASVLAETVIFIIQLLYMHKKDNIQIGKIFTMSFKYIISGIIMLIIGLGVGEILSPNMISTTLQILLGILIYFATLILLKDKLVLSVIDSVLKKIKKFSY